MAPPADRLAGGEGNDVHARTIRLVGALIGAGAALATFAPPAAAVTPKQLVRRAISATEAASAFSFTGRLRQGKTTIALRISSDVENGEGEGTITIDKGTAEVLLVSGTVYLKANDTFWTVEAGQSSATALAGKWVSTSATSANGKQLANFVNGGAFLNAIFNSNLGKSRFRVAGTARVDGQRATVIEGNDPKTKSGGRVYVAKSGTPYILKLVAQSRSGTGTVTFSHFDQPVNPIAPSGAINLDTLGASSG